MASSPAAQRRLFSLRIPRPAHRSPTPSHVQSLAEDLQRLPDHALARITEQLRDRADAGNPTNRHTVHQELIPLAFATACEAIRRTLRLTLYDVQVAAGLALVRGNIAEMQTGEGKTLSAIAPAYARAILGDSVHVATVNDYLAERDYYLVAPVFELLGLRVGLLTAQQDLTDKRRAYACDVLYGPGYEYGFDYLKDQIRQWSAQRPRLGDRFRWALQGQPDDHQSLVQARRDFAMIDEVDSVLLDEAHVPLVISQDGSALASLQESRAYRLAQQAAQQLSIVSDYHIDTKRRRVVLTQNGWDRCQGFWRRNSDLTLLRAWHSYVEQALHAQCLLRRDVDYIVQHEQIHIVDGTTGRVFSDRTWRDGLHQAIQAKEQVAITREQPSIAQISRQRFYRLYRGLSGMTGTAQGSEAEFRTMYGLAVCTIPLRTPSRRSVKPSRFFATRVRKWQAIVADIALRRSTGQPILVGTRTIECSESLAAMLEEQGIPYTLLNGKQDRSEADVVAEAGQAGKVTVATNMAGRGTDISLGHGPPQRVGLHVVLEECNSLYRVDRQIIGRSGRQGDPGSCQSFLAAEDAIFQDHAPALGDDIRAACNAQGDCQRDFTKRVRRVQQRVEHEQFQARQELLRNDRWMEDAVDHLLKEGHE